MSTLINSISKAVSAFKSRNYSDALQELSDAFGTIETTQLINIDAAIFNAIFDAVEISSLMAELPVFEKNDFSESAIRNIKEVLQSFTKPEGGTSADLMISLDEFTILLEGMNVGMKYLQRKNLRPDIFPPVLSFEITADAQIKLYAWTEEKEYLSALISELKAGFEELFEKERKSRKFYLETADALFENGAYNECLQLLEEAAAAHPSLKTDCYLKIGNVQLILNNPNDALDFYMKARVLGASKYQLSEGIKKACQLLLNHSENKSERAMLNNLLEEFSV